MTDPISARVAYDAWAADYDNDNNTTRDLDAVLLRAAALPLRGTSVVEFGAGTGKNTAYLASEARNVIALDFSPGMLERARQRCPDPHVQFVEHDLRQPWPIPSGEADLVVGNLVLEHLSELTTVFTEARRVLRPGGLLYVCELHPFRQLRGSRARFHAGDGEQGVEAYVHLTSDYVQAAFAAGLHLISMAEPHELGRVPDGALPRLLQLTFRRP